jgi:hypothetical protein
MCIASRFSLLFWLPTRTATKVMFCGLPILSLSRKWTQGRDGRPLIRLVSLQLTSWWWCPNMADITTMNENVFWLLAVNSNSAKERTDDCFLVHQFIPCGAGRHAVAVIWAAEWMSQPCLPLPSFHARMANPSSSDCAREEDSKNKKKNEWLVKFFFVGAELLNSDLPAGQREEGWSQATSVERSTRWQALQVVKCHHLVVVEWLWRTKQGSKW